jgi:hypothetical protein
LEGNGFFKKNKNATRLARQGPRCGGVVFLRTLAVALALAAAVADEGCRQERRGGAEEQRQRGGQGDARRGDNGQEEPFLKPAATRSGDGHC